MWVLAVKYLQLSCMFEIFYNKMLEKYLKKEIAFYS